MKKIAKHLIPIFLFCFFAMYSMAQFPSNTWNGNTSTLIGQKGAVGTEIGLQIRYNFADTTAANNFIVSGSSVGFLKRIPGILIRVGDEIYMRSQDLTKWNIQSPTGGGSSGWGLTGNAITAGQFIGTTNAESLVFKTNNQFSGSINENSGSVSLGKDSYSSATGDFNTAIGLEALRNGTSTSERNTGIGAYSLNSLSSGSRHDNTAIGFASLEATNANNNVGLGTFAGKYNTSVSNQIFINNQDRSSYTGDTTLSQIWMSEDPVIGTRIKVNGHLQINDGTQGAGKFLMSDANGVSIWATIPSSGTDTITNAGFSLTKSIVANSITLNFDSSTGFHTQNYNDLRYGSLSQQNANVAAIAQRVLYTDTASMLSPYMRKANNLSDLTNASTARTNLGATTVGGNFFTATNPSAIRFIKTNADNTVSFEDAATFRTSIGAGTGSGTVTAIGVTTANGVSGTSSGGATPNLTISLGAITPTSTNGVSAATMAYMDATSSIQGQLNNKVNISDTASMLSKYLRKIDTTGKWQPVGSYLTSETDPVVKAINGLVKSNGTTIGAVVSGTDVKTINGNSILGSGNIEIPDTSNFRNIAFVDTLGNDVTGVIGRKDKPFATIAGALTAGASIPYLKIKIGVGTFYAPTASPTSFRSNIEIEGSGQPKFNTNPAVTAYDVWTQTVPTALIGGTIIKGPLYFIDKSHVVLNNFGVDVGADWVDNENGGVGTDGVLLAQNYTAGGLDGYHPDQSLYPPTENSSVKNIIILGKYGGSSTHGLLVESKMNALVENITSACFSYCIVFKTYNVTASNLLCINPYNCGLYLKSSYYAHFTGGTISNVNVTTFNNTEAGDGIWIGGENNISIIKNINLVNFTIARCVNGIRFVNFSGSTTAEQCNITNGLIIGNRGYGLGTDLSVNNSSFRDIISYGNSGDGFQIDNGANNSISGLKAVNNTGVGFVLSSSSRLDVSDIFSNGNTGGSIDYGSNVYTIGVTSLSGAIIGTPTTREVGGAGIDSSIYKYDGTLIGNRTVDLSSYKLIMAGTGGAGLSLYQDIGVSILGDEGSFNMNSLYVDDINNKAYYDNAVHNGKFGINTNAPDSAFTLVGGMKVSGGARFTGLIQNTTLDTTSKKIVVADANGVLSKSYWPTGADVYVGAGAGLVPATSGGIGDFYLKQDGTWATVSASLANGDKGDVVVAGGGSTLTVESVNGEFNLKGITSPATYTSDQTNVAYTGSSIIRVNSNSDSRLVTSISGGTDGRIIKIVNVGATDIVLQNDDGSTGTAANRFEFNGVDVVIEPKEGRLLEYDATLQRWVKVAYEYDLNNLRRQPMHEWDYEALGVATANFPTTAIATGTATYIATEAGHPGVLTTTSSATTNSGHYSYYLGVATLYYFQGGETYECIYQPKVASNTNTTTRFGFLDATSSADAVDGAYFEIPAGSFNVVGKTSNNSTRTTSSTIATIAVNTWYRFVIKVNRSASSISFTIYDANGVSLGTQSNTANIPVTSSRVFGVGYVSTNVGTSATLLGWLDRQAFQLGAGKPLNR